VGLPSTADQFVADAGLFRVTVPLVPRIVRATLYGSTIFLSFFLMLVFMTYNVSFSPHYQASTLTSSQAYLILAVVLGAAIGHFVFGESLDVDAVLAGQVNAKGAACH
jgi:copper transporter 1